MLSTGMYDTRERITWKVRKMASKIVAHESIIEEDSPTYLTQFDSNSFRIGVDTLFTHMLSGSNNHFEKQKFYKGQSVKGILGGLEIAGECTFIFRIQSDDRQINTIKIPQSFYVPGLKLPILSPKHWAQTVKDNSPIKFGTKLEADEEGCTVLGQQQTRKKRGYHGPVTRMPIFWTAPGAIQYHDFKATYMAVMHPISITESISTSSNSEDILSMTQPNLRQKKTSFDLNTVRKVREMVRWRTHHCLMMPPLSRQAILPHQSNDGSSSIHNSNTRTGSDL